jgi:spore maturation protein CgeB
MKVLFVGYHNPHYETITEYFEKAFREEGCEVVPFDYRKFIFPGRLRQWCPPLQRWDSGALNARLMELAVRCKPDLTFVNWGGDITPQTMAAIKKATGTKMIFWLADFPGPPGYFDQSAAKARVVDFYGAQSSDNLEAMKRRGLPDGRLLLVACDPDFHKEAVLSEAEKKEYQADACFVGSYEENRVELFLKLIEAFKDRYSFAIWGPGWREKLPADSPLLRFHRRSFLKPDEWTKAYAASKIAINVHHTRHAEGIHHCQAGPRVFEVLACKRLEITNNFTDIVHTFKPGEEIVAFDNVDDLIQKAIFYLEHEEERNRIAANGYAKVISEHTYRHRIRTILSWFKQSE